MSLCQPVIGSMAAMLRDSVVVVVVRTRPRAIPLTMITTRKSTHGFSFVSHIRDAYGAPLGGPSAGGPLRRSSAMNAGVIFISDSMYSRNNVDSFNIAKNKGIIGSNHLTRSAVRCAVPKYLRNLTVERNVLNTLEFKSVNKDFDPLTSKSKNFYAFLIKKSQTFKRLY